MTTHWSFQQWPKQQPKKETIQPAPQLVSRPWAMILTEFTSLSKALPGLKSLASLSVFPSDLSFSPEVSSPGQRWLLPPFGFKWPLPPFLEGVQRKQQLANLLHARPQAAGGKPAAPPSWFWSLEACTEAVLSA